MRDSHPSPPRARCADDLLYDEPPCTDYADLPTLQLPLQLSAAELSMSREDGLPALPSSPAELFQTAAGLPLLLTLFVLVLHGGCCALQLTCGGSFLDEPRAEEPRTALREALRRGGLRAEEAPLAPPREA